MTKIAEQLKRMEEALADPEVRISIPAMDSILHPEFVEVGASGRVFDRASIIELLATESDYSTYEIADFTVTPLGADCALVTYMIPPRDGKKGSRRSSVWVLVEGSWQIRFHQGTHFE